MTEQDLQAKAEEFTYRDLEWGGLVAEADALLQQLFPICRSLTGDGVRRTLDGLRRVAPFELREIPSGTVCYDWVVPEEWNIRDAYVADMSGRRLIDFQDNNLHVVNYSVPFDGVVTFEELDRHLHSLPDLPAAIPYRTAYYHRSWGFCLTHTQRLQMDRAASYRVHIDSRLEPGRLTYGECLLPGTSGREVLISSYCCHPSLANDNLSGIVLWALLLRELQSRPHRHAYRFVILPETIGAIAYLHANEQAMRAVSVGLIPTTVAGPGTFGYKRTYLGDAWIDRAAQATFRELRLEFADYPFDINGSDETQYSSPYFRIPVGTICKDKYYEYDFYHTSLDNLDFISAHSLVESFKLYLLTVEKLELDLTYRSLAPHSEPMLGKRGLYPQTGGSIKQRAVDLDKNHLERAYEISEGRIAYGDELDAIRWVMFHADGTMSLLSLAEKTGFPVKQLYMTAEKLRRHGLLERADAPKELPR
jgi:aminopeptidase-like protein